jgi:hypothetical protein
MPVFATEDNQSCAWTVNCAGGTPSLLFTDLDTETDYDIVHVWDGPANAGTELAHMSGSFVDQTQTSFSSAGSTMAVTFTSDESIGAGGFLASYSCGGGGAGPTIRPCQHPFVTRAAVRSRSVREVYAERASECYKRVPAHTATW